jgi:hypothetical protein
MTQCIVTDIDGTIATKVSSGPNWEAAVFSTPPKPIVPMRSLLQAVAQGGLHIIYSTARRELLRSTTREWLNMHAFPTPSHLFMRNNDLQLAQDVLKLRYLEQIQKIGWQPIIWFEDDQNTVDALRNKGIHAILC